MLQIKCFKTEQELIQNYNLNVSNGFVLNEKKVEVILHYVKDGLHFNRIHWTYLFTDEDIELVTEYKPENLPYITVQHIRYHGESYFIVN